MKWFSKKAHNDVFGEAIRDFYGGKKNVKIKVDSTITEGEEIDVAYLFRKEDQYPELEHQALSLCQGKVLDVGAGAGSHSLFLQKQNQDVTALEKSELAAQIIKQRGVHKVASSDLFVYSPEKYDTILMLMNGLGIVGSIDKLPAFFEQMKKVLTPNGNILVESTDIMYMYTNDEDGAVDINLYGKYYGELTYDISYKKHQQSFDWLFLSFDLLSDYAEKNGFHCEFIFGGPEDNYLARLTQIIN